MTPRYRWVVLVLGIVAQAAFAGLLVGLPSIAPALRSEYALSLSGLGTLFGAITLGATVTLIPWGLLTDRIGERTAIAVGLGGTGLALAAGAGGGRALLTGMLFVAGVLGGVTNVASGRAVMGWFPFAERGLAFGMRQAAVPLGGALASLALPALAATVDARAGLIALGATCSVAAVMCALWLRDPPTARPPSTGLGPLRDRRVYRLAVGSGALVVCQAAVLGFVTVFLHEARGVSPVVAGAVLAAIQAVGVVLRVAVGRRSDRLGRRLRPLRRMAGAIAATWLVAPLLLAAPLGLLIPILVAAGALTFGWNGLSFNAAAELGEGPRSGTAIAVQQTSLFGVAAMVSPAFGLLAEATSWPVAFGLTALGPAAGWVVLRPLAIEEVESPQEVPGGAPPSVPEVP